MDDVLGWVEQHPWLAGAIGLGGLLVLLWLLGFFSSSSSSSSSTGTNNLAAAYYNAEAAQTTAGTQLQMATEMYAAQTAQDQIQATGAEAIASTQAGMYTTLGQQNAGVSTALGNDQLLASQNSNDDALAASNTAAMYGYQSAIAGYNASEMNTYMNSLVNPVLVATGGAPFAGVGPTGQGVNVGVGPPSIAGLMSEGYSQSQATQIAQAAGWPIT